MNWWIYGLVDPEKPEMVRYVGVTHQRPLDRYRQHLSDALVKNCPYPRNFWIRKIAKLGRTAQMVLLEFGGDSPGDHPDEWAERERYWIRVYKNLYPGRLLNAAEGGHSNKGCKMPQSHRDAVSRAMKNRIISDETRRKQSIARLGIKLPPEQIRKMAESKICTTVSLEVIHRRSSYRIGQPLSSETVEKMRNGEYWKKLNLEQAREIRRRRFKERLSMSELGRQYGVTAATINSILKERHYQENPNMRLMAIRGINDEQAAEIKSLNRSGVSQCELARRFNASRRAISYILIDKLTKQDFSSKASRSSRSAQI